MDVGELLSYQPKKVSKRKVPEQFEKRPKVRKTAEAENDTYQFKKILKKAPQPREVQSDPDINIQTIHKKAETERERLLALVENSNEEGETIDSSTIKRYLLNFEKKVTKNQEARIKFPDQPENISVDDIE